MAKVTAVRVELTIDPTGVLVDPRPGRAEPGRHLVFILANHHETATFDVAIDFDAITLKQDHAIVKNPLKNGGKGARTLTPGEVDIIKQKIKAANNFPPTGTFPYTTYKYTVTVTNTGTGISTAYDPDIDVPPA